jgi:hypothetical protein
MAGAGQDRLRRKQDADMVAKGIIELLLNRAAEFRHPTDLVD